MVRNGCLPTTVFQKATAPWPSICDRCKGPIKPTYDSIATKARRWGDAPRGCRPCADRERAEKFRLGEDELARTIAKANIQLLEPYTNNRTSVGSLCLNEGCPRAGKPIKVSIKTVRQGAMACKYCARRAIDPDVAVTVMRDKGCVEPSTVYARVDVPWPGTCLRCQRAVKPRLHDVMQGQGACMYCAPNTPLSLEQAWARAIAYRFRPDDPEGFKNTNASWAGTCLNCDGPVNPALGNLYRGQGACNSRVCKVTGFKDSEPGIVYLLQRTSGPAMAKIGICEDSDRNTRLRIHRHNGWEVVYTREFRVGLHARLVEAAVKRLWFGERAWKNGAARGEQWSDGYTETVLLEDPARGQPWSLLTPVALWTDVATLTERLGFDLDEQRAGERA
ncbi:hypothetical protein [Streptomyces sp. NBC_00009]|uniref:hypothetical protein n=1 Tax=Streptomyces sp. NBC_00009 TaxID=2975620 RepID=UPI0032507CA9